MKRTTPPPPIVEVVHPSYQPSKAELEEDMRVNATFEEAVKPLERRMDLQGKCIVALAKMKRTALTFCLAALAMPASADECETYRDALARAKVTSTIVVHLSSMQELIEVFSSDEAYTSTATMERAEAAAVSAFNTALAVAEAAVATAGRAGDAEDSALRSVVTEFKDASRDYLDDTDPSVKTPNVLQAAYHEFVLAIACPSENQ